MTCLGLSLYINICFYDILIAANVLECKGEMEIVKEGFIEFVGPQGTDGEEYLLFQKASVYGFCYCLFIPILCNVQFLLDESLYHLL